MPIHNSLSQTDLTLILFANLKMHFNATLWSINNCFTGIASKSQGSRFPPDRLIHQNQQPLLGKCDKAVRTLRFLRRQNTQHDLGSYDEILNSNFFAWEERKLYKRLLHIGSILTEEPPSGVSLLRSHRLRSFNYREKEKQALQSCCGIHLYSF